VTWPVSGPVAGALPVPAPYQAALDIRARLAAADPANRQWLSDLVYVEGKLRELPDSGEG
jgi:hypothetical protein